MKSIRKFAYAGALALSSLTFTLALASAQEAHGKFTLTHDVRWQNVPVPAGEYKFSVESKGPSEMLILHKVSGEEAGFMILVTDTETAKPSATNKLAVLSRPDGRFVSTMELPEVGLTLRFAVPAETRELAQANTVPASSSR